MVESALHHIKILEDLDFHDIIVSMKASDVNLAIEAYEKHQKHLIIRSTSELQNRARCLPER